MGTSGLGAVVCLTPKQGIYAIEQDTPGNIHIRFEAHRGTA